MTRLGEGTLRGVGGLRLTYHAWEATRARAAVVVVHGLGEHSGRYAAFGTHMAAAGISTYALDLRGHGLSDGRRGHVQRFDLFLQDLDRFRREVEALTEERVPTFLLGHSMGGLIALRYEQEYAGRFDGAIIISPWLATAVPMPRARVAAAGLLSRLLPALPLRSLIDADHLSRSPDVAASYRTDPLVHDRITPRLFTEAATATGLALQRVGRIRQPTLIMLAGDDRIVDTDRSARFARSITAPDCTVRVFPGAYHELLNEVDQVETHGFVADWILQRA